MANQLNLFSQQQSSLTTDDYYTPRWVFDALGLLFDLDVASPPEGPLYTPTKHYFSQEDDGLASPWKGIVFMNPPYSSPKLWVQKWINHGDGIALLPFAKSSWCESLWEHPETSVIYLKTMKFVRTDKQVNNQPPFSLGLWAIGSRASYALINSRLGKVR